MWTALRRDMRGEPTHLTTTIEGGKFVFHGLRPGIYAIGGYGDNTPLTVLSGLDVYGAGETYAILGKVDGTPGERSDIAAGNGGAVTNGIDELDNPGMSGVGAGDGNGDGRDVGSGR